MSFTSSIHYATAQTGGKVFSNCNIHDLGQYAPGYFKGAKFDCDAHVAGLDLSKGPFAFEDISVAAHRSLTLADINVQGTANAGFSIDGGMIDTNAALTLLKFDAPRARLTSLTMKKKASLFISSCNLQGLHTHALMCHPEASIWVISSDLRGARLPSKLDIQTFRFIGSTDLRETNLTADHLGAAREVDASCLLPAGVTHEAVSEAHAAHLARRPAVAAAPARATAAPCIA